MIPIDRFHYARFYFTEMPKGKLTPWQLFGVPLENFVLLINRRALA